MSEANREALADRADTTGICIHVRDILDIMSIEGVALGSCDCCGSPYIFCLQCDKIVELGGGWVGYDPPPPPPPSPPITTEELLNPDVEVEFGTRKS